MAAFQEQLEIYEKNYRDALRTFVFIGSSLSSKGLTDLLHNLRPLQPIKVVTIVNPQL